MFPQKIDISQFPRLSRASFFRSKGSVVLWGFVKIELF